MASHWWSQRKCVILQSASMTGSPGAPQSAQASLPGICRSSAMIARDSSWRPLSWRWSWSPPSAVFRASSLLFCSTDTQLKHRYTYRNCKCNSSRRDGDGIFLPLQYKSFKFTQKITSDPPCVLPVCPLLSSNASFVSYTSHLPCFKLWYFPL